jgi:hypothetical protein
VRTLGVDPAKTVGTVDDASFLGFDAAPPAGGAVGASGAAGARGAAGAPAPYLAVSLSAHVGDADRAAFATAVARLLDRVAGEAGLEVVFLAHWASLDPTEERGDSLLHRAVLDQLTVPARVEPTTDSPAAARFARGAALHLTSRYHPAVFAVAGGRRASSRPSSCSRARPTRSRWRRGPDATRCARRGPNVSTGPARRRPRGGTGSPARCAADATGVARRRAQPASGGDPRLLGAAPPHAHAAG